MSALTEMSARAAMSALTEMGMGTDRWVVCVCDRPHRCPMLRHQVIACRVCGAEIDPLVDGRRLTCSEDCWRVIARERSARYRRRLRSGLAGVGP